MTGVAPRARIALPGVAACVALLITDVGPSSASCPAQCPAPATWTQPFSFAGLTWERKSGCGGPGPNCWAPENVELEPSGGLRLRLTRRSGRWYAAEIRTVAPVPFAAYSFYLIGRPDLLDPNVVLGVFLYDDAAGEAGALCPDELDLESSRFGDAGAPNGHFVTYASGACGPADLDDFDYSLTGTHTTHQIDWTSGAVSFRLMHGHRLGAELPEYLIGERSFVSPLVPEAGGMRLHVNLWAFAGNAPTNQQEVEVVIRDVVSTGAVLAAASSSSAVDRALAVRQNPSHGGVDIHLALPADEHARVTILDVTGRRVATLADATFPAGRNRAALGADAGNAGSLFRPSRGGWATGHTPGGPPRVTDRVRPPPEPPRPDRSRPVECCS
jgi:hypothetical protein